MNILFVAPIPEPITGHSLASQVFLDDLKRFHSVRVVNLSKDSLVDGEATFRRIVEVVKILFGVWRNKRGVDVIYLTVSESLAGNIKDLFIYLICLGKISRMYIHLHGGSIGRLLFERHRILAILNRIFIKRLAGVIVTGTSHVKIFEGMIEQDRIHVVPNFAEEYLFLSDKEICDKYSNACPLRVLFLGGLINKKGYNELAEAYLLLGEEPKESIRIDFAGMFESEAHKKMFLEKIYGINNISYHGIVSGMGKRSLFSRAHIFCLPTELLEGQPIAILEAYASGCVVATTNRGGIGDIFTDGVNGFEIKERAADAVSEVLLRIMEKREDLVGIAMLNRNLASRKYRTSTYNSALRAIIASMDTGSRCTAERG